MSLHFLYLQPLKDSSFISNALHCTEVKKELNLSNMPNSSKNAGVQLLHLGNNSILYYCHRISFGGRI